MQHPNNNNEYINKIQQDSRVCRYLFTAKLLSTCFGCPSHASSGEHETINAAYGTVLCSPDDGCDGHPKHVQSNFAVNQHLHIVASCWILLI